MLLTNLAYLMIFGDEVALCMYFMFSRCWSDINNSIAFFLLEIDKLEMLHRMHIKAYVLWTYLLYQLYEIKMSLPFKQTFYIVWYYSSWNKSFEDLKMPLFTWFYGTKLHFKEYKFGSMYLTSVYKSICRWMCMHFILMLRFESSNIHYPLLYT